MEQANSAIEAGRRQADENLVKLGKEALVLLRAQLALDRTIEKVNKLKCEIEAHQASDCKECICLKGIRLYTDLMKLDVEATRVDRDMQSASASLRATARALDLLPEDTE